jgi:hypothetical protein
MTEKPAPTYGDLEYLLSNTHNATVVVQWLLEEAHTAIEKQLGEDAANALLYAALDAMDRAKAAKDHWYAAHAAAHRKTAA